MPPTPSRKTTTAVLLALVTLGCAVLVVLVARLAIRTITGQALDTVALAGNALGRDHLAGPLNQVLNAISLASLVVILIVLGAIALARRRYSLAIMAVVLVAGSDLTALLLKRYLSRPYLGLDPDRAGAGNSLPSGHATAAASFAVALVLVLPPAVRGLASVIGATYAGVVGVATLSSGWHRPSDVIAAYLIVSGWAAFSGLVLLLAQRASAVVAARDKASWSLAVTLGGGTGLVIAGAVILTRVYRHISWPVENMNPATVSAGYLGAALAIGGTAYLMAGIVLVTVHRVVPHAKSGPTAADWSLRPG